jgi:hypothetical protein
LYSEIYLPDGCQKQLDVHQKDSRMAVWRTPVSLSGKGKCYYCCEICGFQWGDNSSQCLLGYGAASFCGRIPTFQRSMLPPSSLQCVTIQRTSTWIGICDEIWAHHCTHKSKRIFAVVEAQMLACTVEIQIPTFWGQRRSDCVRENYRKHRRCFPTKWNKSTDDGCRMLMLYVAGICTNIHSREDKKLRAKVDDI